jgi:hypothetical protein
MEAHTPKRYAVERFITKQAQHAGGWQVRVVDEQENPVLRLEAVKQGSASGEPKKLEVHTRQVNLVHDDIDESTKKLITRWLDSLSSGSGDASLG